MIVFGGMDAADVSARLEAFHAEITNLTVTYEGVTFAVCCSLGAVSAAPDQVTEAFDRRTLLTAADQALYEAKRSGRNRIVYRVTAEGHFCRREVVIVVR